MSVRLSDWGDALKRVGLHQVLLAPGLPDATGLVERRVFVNGMGATYWCRNGMVERVGFDSGPSCDVSDDAAGSADRLLALLQANGRG